MLTTNDLSPALQAAAHECHDDLDLYHAGDVGVYVLADSDKTSYALYEVRAKHPNKRYGQFYSGDSCWLKIFYDTDNARAVKVAQKLNYAHWISEHVDEEIALVPRFFRFFQLHTKGYHALIYERIKNTVAALHDYPRLCPHASRREHDDSRDPLLYKIIATYYHFMQRGLVHVDGFFETIQILRIESKDSSGRKQLKLRPVIQGWETAHCFKNLAATKTLLHAYASTINSLAKEAALSVPLRAEQSMVETSVSRLGSEGKEINYNPFYVEQLKVLIKRFVRPEGLTPQLFNWLSQQVAGDDIVERQIYNNRVDWERQQAYPHASTSASPKTEIPTFGQSLSRLALVKRPSRAKENVDQCRPLDRFLTLAGKTTQQFLIELQKEHQPVARSDGQPPVKTVPASDSLATACTHLHEAPPWFPEPAVPNFALSVTGKASSVW